MAATHERVIAALERREPDRVPTMDMMLEAVADAGIPPGRHLR